jgi:CRISPR-associated protein Cas5d
MKVERVTYDMMTPSAARGLVEAIFWHPGLRYIVDEIDLLAPIKTTNIRRNEIKSKIVASTAMKALKKGESMAIYTSRDIVQRASLVLQDVHYCITVHFEMTDNASEQDNPGKFCEILRRRARKGQCYHQPYFGTREFPASFRLVEDDETVNPYPETRDLGYMLYDMDYSAPAHITPSFFHARLENGVMDLRNCEVHL